MSSLKILVLNPKSESLSEVLAMANTLNSKSGPFACAFLLGDSLEDINEIPELKMNLPTYVGSGSKRLKGSSNKSFDLGNNITLLSGCGLIKLSNGLKIGYISDSSRLTDDERSNVTNCFEAFSKENRVDLLFTYDWSDVIAKRENLSLGNEFVDRAVSTLQPKYHFSGKHGSLFFELEPFSWGESNVSISRFINVAQFDSGAKWAYAFNFKLDEASESCIPDNLIDNPYTETSSKRELADTFETIGPIAKKQRKPKQILPSECRFCLSNPNVEDHLIIAISKQSYITVAKGPLSVPQNDLEFSGHCLIIPIDHIPKLNSAQEENSLTELPLFKDLAKFEVSIAEMFYKRYDMSTLLFEINSSNSVHFHKQLLPVPKYLINNFINALDRQTHLNNEKFKGNCKFDFTEFDGFNDVKYLALVNNPKTNYLQFTIRETHFSTPKIYLSTFEKDDRIDLQFGRKVAAFLLKQPKRTRWDSEVCAQTKEEEEQDVLKFQKAYKDFDFTVE